MAKNNKPSFHENVLKEPPATYGDEIILYQSPDGSVKLDVRLEKDNIWLSINQMAMLFERDKSVSRGIYGTYTEKVSWTVTQLLHFLQQFKTKGAVR
jgi:hypothetical protein